MNTSVIRYRVADILRRYAPFDSLEEADLLDLSGSGRVKFHESDEYVYQQGQPTAKLVWIIQQGRVDLIDESSGREQLRDVLGEGDLIGLERFAGENQYPCSARTATDVILYAFSTERFEALISRYPAVRGYLTAHFSAANTNHSHQTSWLDADAPPDEFLRARCAKSRQLAGGTSASIASPVNTREAVLTMVQARSEILVITGPDGTDGGGDTVLTASDLALFCGRNPTGLLREILGAASLAELAPLLKLATRMLYDALARPGDAGDCSHIASQFQAAVTETCIKCADAEVEASGFNRPDVRSCWLSFGSAARGDLIRPSFPCLAAVYDDSEAGPGREAAAYFATLTGRSAAWFRECGLEGPGMVWPEGAHSCMPLSEWKRLYSETVRNPMEHELYARREFFDLLPLSGDRAVAGKVHAHVIEELRDPGLMILLLANDTLSNLPPLTFFRGMVLDLDGGRQESFDMDAAVTGPIADAARVFALAQRRLSPVNTLDRLEAAGLDYHKHERVFRDAADAFRIGIYHQTRAGTCRIEPSGLERYDQRLLKTAFLSTQRLLELVTATFLPRHD